MLKLFMTLLLLETLQGHQHGDEPAHADVVVAQSGRKRGGADTIVGGVEEAGASVAIKFEIRCALGGIENAEEEIRDVACIAPTASRQAEFQQGNRITNIITGIVTCA